MKKLPISLVCGVSAMLITILIYGLLLRNGFLQAICMITLLGVLVAEGLTTLLAYLAKGQPRRVAAAVLSLFMTPYAIVLSSVYITRFPNGYGAYAGWYFVGLLIVGGISGILYIFNDRKTAENDSLQNAKEHMISLRKLVMCIKAHPAAAAHQKEWAAVEEKLHFTNDSVIVSQDAIIESMLNELLNQLNTSEVDIPVALEKINQVIDTRIILTKNTI